MDPFDLSHNDAALGALTRAIKDWGKALGFSAIGISDVDLGDAEAGLEAWLAAGFHGEMDYMTKHGLKRARPAELIPGTIRVIAARLDYFPQRDRPIAPGEANIARYAWGRDYHKVMRAKLKRLAAQIEAQIGDGAYRVFCDSAPVLEVEIAEKAGLGWRGKHTLLLSREAGSWYFLGEIYTNLPLPIDEPVSAHCGACSACIDICPTRAIIAPYRLDARRCISYLTIEHRSAIPEPLRPLIGNRIYGCDDCQEVCPWNRFAQMTHEPDFAPREALAERDLCALFAWDEREFAQRTQGSAIHRIGHARWLRNIAVALGNAPTSRRIIASLEARTDHPSALVREHVHWALAQHAQLVTSAEVLPTDDLPLETRMNPGKQLNALGQSIWLDNLSRDLTEGGGLRRYIDDFGISGVTSNPSIFFKAFSDSQRYQTDLKRLRENDPDPESRYEALVVPDIQAACDAFLPIYEASAGNDGYVSLEVSPRLADNSASTLEHARRLAKRVARPNLMVKVPGTPAGAAAFEQLIAEGINVNVTLLFSLHQTVEIFNAYIRGLRARHANGGDVRHVKAVASLFLSRVDSLVDTRLDAIGGDEATRLRGKSAVAMARLAYQRYRELFHGTPFADLMALGARPQYLLWASTGTKNPQYSDLLYVENLIGPETINTLPDATLAALRDHGKVEATLERDVDLAEAHFLNLKRVGVDMRLIGEQLQKEGLELFEQSFGKIIEWVGEPAVVE